MIAVDRLRESRCGASDRAAGGVGFGSGNAQQVTAVLHHYQPISGTERSRQFLRHKSDVVTCERYGLTQGERIQRARAGGVRSSA